MHTDPEIIFAEIQIMSGIGMIVYRAFVDHIGVRASRFEKRLGDLCLYAGIFSIFCGFVFALAYIQ